ncbi:MAG: hypothetical protein ACRBN8_22255 [Nannocystales bacterium]
MSDASGQPPADGEEGIAKDPEFRDDALSELMTGAFAATSMVTMGGEGGEGDLPAPPVWAPSEDAPQAEGLDDALGSPAPLPSGPHDHLEPELEIDTDFEEDIPALAVADVAEPRPNEAVTVPLSGPDPEAEPVLRPPSVDMPISSDDYPAHLGYVDDDGEGAASISTDSGVVVTPKHAQGAMLTGAYPTISPQLRSPAPRREQGSAKWLIGGAVLVGLVVIGAVVMMSGGTAGGQAAGSADTSAEPSTAAVVPNPAAPPSAPETPGPAPTPGTKAPESTASDSVAPSGQDAPAAAGDDPKPAYAAALARYEANPDNPGLLELTLTACALGLGPEARTAFHKLVGGKARSKAVVKCREAGIDVTSKARGYTGPEIAAQAREALDDGRASDALALAKQSNRTERNHAALEVMVLAHCELKQKKSAKKLLRHISERHRKVLVDDCAKRGVKLRR